MGLPERPHRRWSAHDLPRVSKVGVAAIVGLKTIEGEIPVTAANGAALRAILEFASLAFIEENGGGPGVRLRKPPKQKR